MCQAVRVSDIVNKAGMCDTAVCYVSGGPCQWHRKQFWHMWHRRLLCVRRSVSVASWTRLACVTQLSVMCQAVRVSDIVNNSGIYDTGVCYVSGVCVCDMNKAGMRDTGVCHVSGNLCLWHHEQGWHAWHRCLLCVWWSVSVTWWKRLACVTQVSATCLAVCVWDAMNKAGMCDTGVYYVSGGLCL